MRKSGSIEFQFLRLTSFKMFANVKDSFIFDSEKKKKIELVYNLKDKTFFIDL